MKSVGEVMSIGRTFEETIQKAIRAIDDQFMGFSKVCRWSFESGKRLTIRQNEIVDDIDEELVKPTDKRIFAIANAFHRGYTVEQIHRMTNIDNWFLKRLFYIHQMEKDLS